MNRDVALEKYLALVREARIIYPDPKYKELLEESRSIYWEYEFKTKERKDVIPLLFELFKLEKEAYEKKREAEKELIKQRKAKKGK